MSLFAFPFIVFYLRVDVIAGVMGRLLANAIAVPLIAINTLVIIYELVLG